ncbi:hypothetical protein ACNKHK_14250 [Shigella flexneri]
MHITLRQSEVFAEVLKAPNHPGVCHAGIVAVGGECGTYRPGRALGVQLFDRVGKRLVVNEHGACSTHGAGAT